MEVVETPIAGVLLIKPRIGEMLVATSSRLGKRNVMKTLE